MTAPVSSTAVPLIRAHGAPYEAGFAHGAALTDRLRGFLDDGLARLDRVMAAPQDLDTLRSMLAEYAAEIEAATPDLAEEVHGLAAGARISLDEALLLQLRREIMGYSRIPTSGDCTTFARATSPSHTVLAQTVDLNGNVDDQLAVLEVARPNTDRRALVLSFGGLLGYLGINSDGLAVGLNLVLGGDWRPGLPPYLAIRHVLDVAGSVDEALRILGGLRLSSSRSLTLCDRSRAASVEFLGDEMRVVDEQETTHTNHYIHTDFTNSDELNVFARNFSMQRLKACRSAVAGLAADAGVEDYFAVLAEAPICVADHGDVRRERTVAAVLMRPDRGELHLRPGDPSLSATQSFRLE